MVLVMFQVTASAEPTPDHLCPRNERKRREMLRDASVYAVLLFNGQPVDRTIRRPISMFTLVN